jgi:tRNA nucleotidyltransferase (CCA-adding enzyme)
MALRVAAELSQTETVRFAVLTHDLGKGTTPSALLPAHRGHEERSVELLEKVCARLPVPNRFRELAVLVARHHGVVHKAAELRPQTVLKLITETDGLRQPDRFEEFLLACEADARGRKGLRERPYPQAERLRIALRAARAVDAATVRAAHNVEGPELGKAMHDARLVAVKEALR